MPATYLDGSEARHLTDSQIDNLKRILKMERRNPSDPDSVLLSRSAFASLARKGLVTNYRRSTYKGMVPTHLSLFGRSVILKIIEAEQHNA